MATRKLIPREEVNPTKAAAFPSVPTEGHWAESEHDQAVAAYEEALANNDPDAGRLRTLLGIHGFPGRPLASGADFGVRVSPK